ncbi:MAG: alpha/beta fold hydrolase [Deltaproteobacteria bacterium]|nr:alpha/beta fold hydrolase [Deltaproteobacteria bacterium]
MPHADLPTGAKLYYEIHGAGEALLLFPSTAFSGEVWKPYQVPALSKSMQMILHDPRGCPRTTVAQQVYSIEQMANDAVSLLDHLHIAKVHLLGHSMGGRVALTMALNFPGRVKSLIMAASGSGLVTRPGPDCVPGLPHWLLLGMVEKGFEKFLRAEYCESEVFFTKDFRDRHPERIEEFFKLARATHANLSEYIHLSIARHNWEATHRLGDIQVPTLVLIGNNDKARSNHLLQAEALKNRIPGAELQILEGQSHGFFWQAPEETNAVIRDWVTRHTV